MAATRRLTIPLRFRGPPGTANGGYVAGRLAEVLAVRSAVQVTLREPPPLDTPLDITTEAGDPDRVTLTFGGALLAEAQPGVITADGIPPISFEAALDCMSRYDGLRNHPFPGCFVCGTDRPVPDGLGLRPGRVEEHADMVATAWVPSASAADGGEVPVPMVWAALDCPGGWSVDLAGRPMVLGRITALVDAVPDVGDRCVVLGGLRGRQGRKSFTTTTAYDGDGRVLGRAEATWFEVDPARYGAA